jgi:uncharacterized membrane protein YeaQ/YmgE (transglycosylase-associated protein family)
MTLETIVVWIIVGGIAGLLADAVVGSARVGLLEAIVVGIIGAFVGGWLFAALGVFPGGGILGTILTAFVGAVILLVLLGALYRGRRAR